MALSLHGGCLTKPVTSSSSRLRTGRIAGLWASSHAWRSSLRGANRRQLNERQRIHFCFSARPGVSSGVAGKMLRSRVMGRAHRIFNKPQSAGLAGALTLLLVIGLLDALTGNEAGLTLFYALPIMLAV